MIPRPKKFKKYVKEFPLAGMYRFHFLSDENDTIPPNLASDIEKRLQHVSKYYEVDPRTKIDIVFNLQPFPSKKPDGYYELEVSPGFFALNAESVAGMNYAVRTLMQHLYISSSNQTEDRFALLPRISVKDWPTYQWRGMHLDVSRHFYDHNFVKKYLDWMVGLKFNRFHWHLSDDQGWRLESKRFPLLHEKGSWRKESDGSDYGGHYSLRQIKAVLKHASQRGIEVIPEIDIPGHSMSILTAYPELACFPREFEPMNVWGISEDILCAGKDETIDFLKELFTEIAELFPGPYIHIGGDEAPKQRWKECPHCQKRMRDNGLKDEEALQAWLVKTLATHLEKLGKTVIGWDEILDGGIDSKPIVMAWRGDGIDAARMAHDNGNKYILTPYTKLYFDARCHKYDKIGTHQIIPWADVLDFSFQEYTFTNPKLLLGAQGNVWTEHLTNVRDLREKINGRMFPLAERLWNGDREIDTDEFWKLTRDLNWIL
ncbi:MAG: family 20 glycosylhydrolase [Candidatus Cloacimonadaceae bacterium]|jgi:hexosaminidase|nr:family 20 glycosylhydrolase [Candidatus Cloacimonadota bacterium]MDX9950124.1 family 20 glycosylhydrolase [Candidatus Syntrophosphaera sp.]